MRIFDNILLGQYLDVGAKVKVYANSEWYDLVDKSDVADNVCVIGYDEYGGAHRFSYQTIEQIQVNGQVVTLDMLSQKMGDKPSDSGEEGKPAKDTSSDEEGLPMDEPEEEEKPEKGADLSWFSPAYDIGRILMKEKEERKRNSGIKI